MLPDASNCDTDKFSNIAHQLKFFQCSCLDLFAIQMTNGATAGVLHIYYFNSALCSLNILFI